jgi:3-keto-5-aminohexanoate cleavage enzyme
VDKKPLMIMVAPNGARLLKDKNPATPVTPAEIAADVLACARAGASMAHIHARAPDGQPSDDVDVYREIVERIREHSDIVLQLSLGTIGFSVDQALAPLALRPDMVSFPMRNFNEANGQIPADIQEMAVRIKASGVTPELDVAGEPTIAGAKRLIEEGHVNTPLCIGINVKEPETMHEGAGSLLGLTSHLPAHAQWWICKGGKHALGLRALAIELGGHVRTGFEDGYMDFEGKGLAPSNASLVERVARLSEAMGRSIATAADVRSYLKAGNR